MSNTGMVDVIHRIAEYDVVSVYRPGVRVYDGMKQSVLVPKPVYDRDLKGCLDSEEEAMRQFSMDAIRSELRVDGEKVVHHGVVPQDMIRYCTQAVMGIPVMVLWDQLGVVAEPEKESTMRINVTRRDQKECLLKAEKRLRIVNVEGANVSTVYIADVEVVVERGTDFVEVIFKVHRV